MSSLRLATASNVRAFQNLTAALSISDDKWAHAIDNEALEDEIGRFRVWAGNLGALQKGHSSLDYRLRDSPVSSTNTLKLLKELENNVNEAHAVVSGARLPYEEQAPPDLSEDDDNDDGFFSADSDDEDSSSDEPRTELHMRFREIVDIIDNLYKLSVRIRTPGLRPRSLKASSYTQKDPETGIDIFEMYAKHDLRHVHELFLHIRQPYAGCDTQKEQDFLIERLSTSVTLRRRHFKYWKRHRDKLGAAEVADDVQEANIPAPLDGPTPVLNDDVHTNLTVPVPTTLKEAPSQKTGKTLLSGTEATQLHQSLDDIVDSKSVTSYAVTVRDVHGKSIDLPPPPKTANGDKDFECPYCWVVCPARYSKGRAWRTHLLQDLQPYCCTYRNCESPHLLFRSRREWAEHEASHRKVWRCPQHPDAVFSTQSGLENHLRQQHLGSFPESQLENIAKVGEASTVDMRTKCPICCAPADTEELGDLQSHIANHLERIATFALPHSNEEDSDGASGIASLGSTSSRPPLSSISADVADKQNQQEDDQYSTLESDPVDIADPSRDVLSSENLYELPDTSRDALDIISEQLNNPDSSYHQELALGLETPPPLEVEDIPTLSLLYRSRRLLQTDQSYAPNGVYNRMVSFCSLSLTRLKVDAIVNNAPLTMSHTPSPGTLHHAIVKAGGSLLLQEVRSKDRLKPGQVTWTHGYALPSSLVIHAAAPTFVGMDGLVKFKLLGECYRNALETAVELGVKTIAFPCLGTGGGIFPPRQAARTALQAVRDYLDAHPEGRLERVIFCVITAVDIQAYTDFFPVFFPPTHSDLDKARASTSSWNQAMHATQIFDTLVRVQRTTTELTSRLSVQFSLADRDFNLLRRLAAVLDLIHANLQGSEALEANPDDFNLLSSVLLNLCDHLIEMAQLGKARTGETYQELRMKADSGMRAKHGIDLWQLLGNCFTFAQSLNATLISGKHSLDIESRQKLERYMVEEERQAAQGVLDNLKSASGGGPADKSLDEHKSNFRILIGNLDPEVTESGLIALFQSKYPSTNSVQIMFEADTGRPRGFGFVSFTSEKDQQRALAEMQGVHCGDRPLRISLAMPTNESDQLDEVASIQDFTSPASHRRELVKLHQIPSVARFYQLGAIEATPTLAPPSAKFNDTVCLIKEDITRLEVDVIVNITDKSFLGMGTLDRTIFKKGGPELQSELKRLGECNIGDVVTTPGYLLPAKHVLHAIPPGVFRSDTKNILRNLYRDILLKATYLNVKSIAIPCIGMGPPRDCASLAMEEVRRFLQSKEPGGLEKIVFTVYSSHNESIYKRLLPVYFPPPQESNRNWLKGTSLERAETLPSQPTPSPGDSQSIYPEQAPQSVSNEEPLVTVTASVFISEFGQETQRPLCNDLCTIRVLPSSVAIFRHLDHPASPPLMSFRIMPDIEWDLMISFFDMVISQVQRDETPPGDRATVYIRCSEPSDVDVLSAALERAIDQAARDQNEKEEETDQREGDVASSSAAAKGKGTSISNPYGERSQITESAAYEDYSSSESDYEGSLWIKSHRPLPKVADNQKSDEEQIAGDVSAKSKETKDFPSPPSRLVNCPDYKHHMMDPDSGPLPCRGCRVAKMSLVQHHLNHVSHPGRPGAWKCLTCMKYFNDNHGLDEHMEANSCQAQVESRGNIVKQWAMLYLTRYPEAQRIPSPFYGDKTWLPQSVWEECRTSLQNTPVIVHSDSGFTNYASVLKQQAEQKKEEMSRERKEVVVVAEKERAAAGQQADATASSANLTPHHEAQTQEKDTADPFSTKILTHLTNDLRSRPTSYIGQHINDMAAALDTDTETLAVHLAALAEKGKVHTTVNKETWVIDGWEGEMRPVYSSSSGDGGGGNGRNAEKET